MTRQACPLCKSANTVEFWGIVWGAANKTTRQCNDCDLLYIFPQPTVGEQQEFDLNYDKYISERESLITNYVDSTFEMLVNESIEERFNDISTYFLGVSSVMEVGAEKGGFLIRLSQNIKNLTGVDSCNEYRQVLKDHGFENFSYVEDVPKEQKFDRICFFSLLEHILNPVNFMRAVKEHLKPGGLVIAEVPSANDPLLKLYDNNSFKSFTLQAMHPYVYSEKALRILFSKAGFKIKKFQYKQRYGISNHLHWLRKGLPGGAEDLDKIFKQLDNDYISALEKSGYTDSIYIVAEHDN
jgi:2-polyprenyl-3-methyl-5-hydroxy-6-metoxy-1,4-benzoquinol methylase